MRLGPAEHNVIIVETRTELVRWHIQHFSESNTILASFRSNSDGQDVRLPLVRTDLAKRSWLTDRPRRCFSWHTRTGLVRAWELKTPFAVFYACSQQPLCAWVLGDVVAVAGPRPSEPARTSRDKSWASLREFHVMNAMWSISAVSSLAWISVFDEHSSREY